VLAICPELVVGRDVAITAADSGHLSLSHLAQLILRGAGLARSPFRIRVRLLALEILVAAAPAPFLLA
jgi:hypothetical protein